MTISSDALTMISDASASGGTIDRYVLCNLYNYNDVLIGDITDYVESASWSKSRQFGVDVLNITIVNEDDEFLSGGSYPLQTDQIVVLVEGYDTGKAEDKIPTFKGYIKEIQQDISDSKKFNITVYGQLILLQRSDINKIFEADYTSITDETLTPYITETISVVDAITTNQVKIKYNLDNTVLDTLMLGNFLYIENYKYKIDAVMSEPTNLPRNDDGTIRYVSYSSISGSFSAGNALTSESGNFSCSYVSAVSGAEDFLLVSGVSGYLGDGEKLYYGSNIAVVNSYYHVQLISDTNINRTPSDDGIVVGDRVHNGYINTYKSTNPNWSGFRSHRIKYFQTSGAELTDDPYDGFEVNHDKGIVRFNKSQPLDIFEVKASYKYYPQGLLVEDVIRDLIIEEDALDVDIIKNGNFNLGDYGWTDNASTTADYTITKLGKATIYCNGDINPTEYIATTQDITLSSGYTYTFSLDTFQESGISGSLEIYFDLDKVYSATDFTTWTTQSFEYTCTSTTTFTLAYLLRDLNETDIVVLNNAKCTYNPSKVNSLGKSNLYCKRSIELGSASDYTLTNSSLSYIVTPKYNYLNEEFSGNGTVIKLNDVTGFEASGTVQIESEMISYTGISGVYLTGLTRGFNSTTEANHLPGSRVYEVLPQSRVWYLDYNNIIPATSDTTASDYGYTSAVDLGSGDFTISGSTFSKIYYRQGIVVTATSATAVTLKSGTDYIFNQLQSTGIEMPFILLDYKKLKTKYDALQEITSRLAPNYIIRESVRKDGSSYISFIKGSYIFQKLSEDYDIKAITRITRTTPDSKYNRVKMFGKVLNPSNVMYLPETTVFAINDMDEEYIRGLEYVFERQTGNWYVFTNTSLIYNTLEANGRTKSYEYLRRVGPSITSKPQDFPFLLGLTEQDKVVGMGWQLITKSQDYGGRERSTRIVQVMELITYTPYYITYNDTSEFSVNDTVTVGAKSGEVKRLKSIDPTSNIDNIIFITHDRDSSVFSDTEVITNGTASATISIIDINGFTSIVGNTYPGDITSVYDVTTRDLNSTIDTNFIQSVDTKIYVNGWQVNNGSQVWNTKTVEPSTARNVPPNDGWVDGGFLNRGTELKKYVRDFDNEGMYINRDETEYLVNCGGERKNNTEDVKGTVTLKKINFDGSVDPNYTFRLNYIGEPGADIRLGHLEQAVVSEFLKNRGQLFYNLKSGNIWSGSVGEVMRKCNSITYYTYKGGEVDYKFVNEKLYLNKRQFDNLGWGDSTYTPYTVNNVTVDGLFKTKLNTNYNDNTRSLISRIRNNTVKSKEGQIGLVSQTSIEDFPLYVVDLGESKRIKYIDLQGGFVYIPNNDSAFPCTFKVSLKHSNTNLDFGDIDDDDFDYISDKTIDVDISEGQTIIFEEGDLGEYFETRYIKVYVNTTTSPNVTVETDALNTSWYGASITSMAVYSDDVIVSEKYVNSDVINLYKDSTVYEELYTQELLDTVTQANLDEFQKNGNTVGVDSIAGVHYEIGQTLRLNDTESSINTLKFLEEISSNNGNITMTLSNYN